LAEVISIQFTHSEPNITLYNTEQDGAEEKRKRKRFISLMFIASILLYKEAIVIPFTGSHLNSIPKLSTVFQVGQTLRVLIIATVNTAPYTFHLNLFLLPYVVIKISKPL
jgi:hypothetical protein